MKSTLKRSQRDRETVGREAHGGEPCPRWNSAWRACTSGAVAPVPASLLGRGQRSVGGRRLRCCLRTFRPDSSARIASDSQERWGRWSGRASALLGAYSPSSRLRPRSERRSRCVAALFAGEARSATGSVFSVGRAPTLASSRCRATRLETRTKECRRRASLWVKETRLGRSEVKRGSRRLPSAHRGPSRVVTLWRLRVRAHLLRPERW